MLNIDKQDTVYQINYINHNKPKPDNGRNPAKNLPNFDPSLLKSKFPSICSNFWYTIHMYVCVSKTSILDYLRRFTYTAYYLSFELRHYKWIVIIYRRLASLSELVKKFEPLLIRIHFFQFL